MVLSVQFFSSLFSEDGASREVLIPEFDNSEFNGEGDRVPEEKWNKVVISPESGIDVIVLEGWCVGFQPLDESVLEEKWKKGKYESEISTRSEQQFPMRTLQNHELSSYIEINRNLQTYCDVFMGPQHLDYLVHPGTDDLMNVYRWRMQQEHALRRSQDAGMPDEQVISFVECYMPA